MATVNIIDSGLKFGSLTKRSKTVRLILHHTAATSMTDAQIHQQHLNQGWAGIGYNFYIRKDGTVYKGRGWEYVGAHCTGYNSTSIGICFEGNYETETDMPDAQYNSGVAMIALVLEKYPTITDIGGHKHYMATACPGKNFPLDRMIAAGQGATGSVSGTTSTGTNTTAGTSTPAAISTDDAKKAGIKCCQTWLNGFGNYGLAVDGIYGSATRTAAKKAMQTIIGTGVDGDWGTKSKAACVTLKSGSTGNAVYVLQGMLYCRGYIYSGVDGVYGAMTVAEVKSYQGANGLTPDGIAGLLTFTSLFSK